MKFYHQVIWLFLRALVVVVTHDKLLGEPRWRRVQPTERACRRIGPAGDIGDWTVETWDGLYGLVFAMSGPLRSIGGAR